MRSVRIEIDHPVAPYLRRTHQGRFSPRATAYHANQDALKTLLTLWMREGGFEPWGKDARLALGCEFRLSKRVGNTDLSNLVKAIEDAGNGVLYPDDRQIWEYLPCSKAKALAVDGFALTVREVAHG